MTQYIHLFRWINISYARIFCELHSIFSSPVGVRKNASNEQNVRSYYMLNHRIRDLLFYCKISRLLCYFPYSLCSTGQYRLIFCVFSWPYMVKWRNSGIINYLIEWLNITGTSLGVKLLKSRYELKRLLYHKLSYIERELTRRSNRNINNFWGT